MIVADDTVVERVLASQHRGTRRAAERGLVVHRGESQAHLEPETADVGETLEHPVIGQVAQVIDGHEDDVRGLVSRGRAASADGAAAAADASSRRAAGDAVSDWAAAGAWPAATG